MSERKVLNVSCYLELRIYFSNLIIFQKYYPPDFDPSKIPRLRLPKTRQYTVRIMAPCNMRCNTCGDYIAKGKKFNARKETVDDESYLGLKVFRFYFRCPRCMAEITFKTDPRNMDYEVEHGATQNFKALKLAEQQAEQEQREKEEEEKLNPMKLLENRTTASRREMESLEALEDLKEINQRQITINFDDIFKNKQKELEQQIKQQEKEDEEFIQSIFPKLKNDESIVKKLPVVNEEEEVISDEANQDVDDSETSNDIDKQSKSSNGQNLFNFAKKSTDLFVTDTNESKSDSKNEKLTSKRRLKELISVKKKVKPTESTSTTTLSASTSLTSTATTKTLLCSYSDSESDSN